MKSKYIGTITTWTCMLCLDGNNQYLPWNVSQNNGHLGSKTSFCVQEDTKNTRTASVLWIPYLRIQGQAYVTDSGYAHKLQKDPSAKIYNIASITWKQKWRKYRGKHYIDQVTSHRQSIIRWSQGVLPYLKLLFRINPCWGSRMFIPDQNFSIPNLG